MEAVNEKFIISLIIILFGYLLKRKGLVRREEGNVLVKIIMNITLPAVLLSTFPYVKVTNELLLLSLISIGLGFSMYFIGSIVFRLEERANKGILIISNIGLNIGLFAYPFVESIWGTKGLQYIAAFDMGNAFIIFVLSYLVSSSFSPKKEMLSKKEIFKKLFTFIPLLTFIISIAISIFQIQLPNITVTLFDQVAAANGILVLIVLGIYLDFSLDTKQLKNILKVIFLKYGFGIAIGATLFYFLPYSQLFKGTILLGLILPTSMTTLAYAIENELNDRITGGVINLTNIISFILMWIIFHII